MDKSSSSKSNPFTINQKNNRFILKFFGEMDHDYMTIENDSKLTISKMRIDNLDNKGQISKWQFNLDRIYTPDTTFDELYENEIESSDYLNEFNKTSQYRTLSFIGDRNDSLTEEPYKDFIIKCVKECLSDMNNMDNKLNKKNNEDNLIPIVSFCELNKNFVVDYFKENDKKNSDVNKNNSKGILLNQKLNTYEDDLIIDGISQIQISDEKELNYLMNLTKKNLEYVKLNQFSKKTKKESLTQILTFKLIKSKTNECFSKINFVLYKAYEILSNEEKEESFINSAYDLYTKDNYNFFNGVQNKINYRLSYVIKYIKDTLVKGNNLFIVILPCEYQYLLLIHDLLDNIKMRKLIVENILINDENEESINHMGEIYRFENISELNPNNGSFESFSKNNSILINVSSALDGKGFNFLGSSYYENKVTEGKNKRKEINYERLRKISNKTNVIKLFDMFDQLSLQNLDI